MLITHGTIITHGDPNRVIDDGAILVRGQRIAALGASAELERAHHHEPRLDARGKLVLPGSICAHTHFYGAFARGMALPGEPPRDFAEILRGLWWRLDKALGPEDIRFSALTCLVDAIRHGTTTLVDHHASPGMVDGSLDIIAEAVLASGLRACLCYETSDRDGPKVAAAGIRENTRFAERARGDARLAGMMGLHASMTLSHSTLDRARDAASGLDMGFHIHVAEGMADVEDALRRYGKRVVARLADHSILGPDTIAAHCVHVAPDEIQILAETQTWVVHNPRSNMNNAVGTAPVERMLDRGVRVGLGNDGFSNNMYSEFEAAYLIHKATRADPRAMSADKVLRLSVEANSALASRLFGQPVGTLTVGSLADIVLADYQPPTPITAANWPWHIAFGLDGSHVATTIASGDVLMRDRTLTQLDDAEIAARSRALATKLWQRI